MAKTSNYTCRIDAELRSQSEALFGALGMNLGTAINVFLRKAAGSTAWTGPARGKRPEKGILRPKIMRIFQTAA